MPVSDLYIRIWSLAEINSGALLTLILTKAARNNHNELDNELIYKGSSITRRVILPGRPLLDVVVVDIKCSIKYYFDYIFQ